LRVPAFDFRGEFAMQIVNVTGKVSKDRLAALGRLCIHWSILESRIEFLIWAIRGTPRKAGRKITADMPLQPRLHELKKTAKQHLKDPKFQDVVFNYITVIKMLAKERNWFVHGLWGHGTTVGEKRNVYAVSYFKRHEGGSREASVRNLQTLTGQIILTANTIDKFITKGLGVPLP
jgi:hypothetical protein